MNVYQKMLVKLYDETGGKDSISVDLKDLTKKEGFYASYNDIYKHLSQQGWIINAGRDGVVKITHWGVKEAKKSQTSTGDEMREIKKTANRLKEETKEMFVMTEELVGDLTEENLKLVKGKLDDVKNIFEKLQANF